ncbi:MAG: DeoR/GlpR family DNA-binding transcription regulator [Chloroflexota bacterium]|nr:DeoR/GlpR family DNA-binding transcription regulator [Chloroflexota bacterium]
MPALTAERRAAITRMVAEEGAVHVRELATHFGVNAATIRRDLKVLEEQGRVRRVRGGAVPVAEVAAESTAGLPETQAVRIGQAVAEMVADGETVFLSPGRLPLEVVRCLSAHSRLTIVTSGLGVAHWVAVNTSHTLIVTGGQVEGRGLGLAGQLTRVALSSLRADHVILELGGVSAVDGLTDDSLPQAEIAQRLLEIGSQVIVLVPAERVGRVAAAYIAPVSEADVIVTAREVHSSFLWDLSEAGVRIVLA